VIALAVAIALASASPKARHEAEALYEQAEREERDLDFGAALAHYESSVKTDPSNRWALRATARAHWLRQRSEAGFVPLVKLERLRRDPTAQGDAQAIDSLAGDLERFPPGEVRVEARMYVAEAYATKLARPKAAERELDALLDEPNGDPPLKAQAAERLAGIAMARDDVPTARRAAARVTTFDPPLGKRVARWARRRILERGAVATLALFALLAGQAAARRLRGERLGELVRVLPRAAAICAYLALGATLLANAFEHGHALPFVLLPASALVVAALSRAWALSSSSSRRARAARAVFGVLAVASAAFLLLDRIDVRYLESFGL
jgi:hypothetical protein